MPEGIDAELSRISERVREWREAAGLTLQDLATRAGVAVSTVQKIESAAMVPSVAVLLKVARGLRRNPGELLGEAGDESVDLVHLPAGARHCVGRRDHLVVERLSGDLTDPAIEVWRVTMQPGATSGAEPIHYSGEEFIYCEKGCITFRVGETDHVLAVGDSLHFKATKPHAWRNDGKTAARFTITGTLPKKLRAVMNRRI